MSSAWFLLLSLSALVVPTVWGRRSLQEELGGTPEAPFGLTAGLVGVGTFDEARKEEDLDNSGSSVAALVAVLVVVLLLLVCCICICCVGGYCYLKRKKSNEPEPVFALQKPQLQVAMGVPLGGGFYSDNASVTSQSFD
uniref:Uncharacterized protein n=1 Tax=Amphora coffeiformis TaxID=265554 RepID=A0A7S3LFB1_9STRA|mmetsp:Transcript_7927/g.15384  ORF Transcript_7927/g.15384 Transcript_7927/m.15384 type:complete len:139 (+) Transcript_7927:63-479(+)